MLEAALTMSKLALISDIHGNLEALIAVLRQIDAARVDHVICLGDVIGYGPDPALCVELISGSCDITIRGNHDDAALSPETPANFNPTAAESLRLTRSLLTDDHLETIQSWQARGKIEGVHVSHASFGRRIYAYILNKHTAAESFDGLNATIGVFGHTHVPAMFACPIDAEPSPENIRGHLPLPAEVRTAIPDGYRALINPGSVGQPRDRNPDASWGLLDTEARSFRTHRVAYDIDAVHRKIRKVGMPDFLGERLRVGA